jgi:hypothetical protein
MERFSGLNEPEERFEYLFQLPYELIIQIVSDFSIKQTDIFCKQVAKEVEYGEGKLYLKEICNDIWYMRYTRKFGHLQNEEKIKNWRDTFIKKLKNDFSLTIKKHLDQLENTLNPNKKVQIIFDILDYILENKELLDLKAYQNFKNIILEKLFGFMIEIPDQEDLLLSYIDKIFGPEHIKNYLSRSKMLNQLFE